MKKKKTKKYVSIFDVQEVRLIKKAKIADKWYSRLLGLLGTKSLDMDSALILYPCNAVHTYGMKYDIQIIVLNKNHEVIEVVHSLRPNRQTQIYKEGYYIIEINSYRLNINKDERIYWK